MASDKINLSFRNSDDTFWIMESSNIREENLTEETKTFSGDSSKCCLSEKEIEHCGFSAY